jgi:hypothetical protein
MGLPSLGMTLQLHGLSRVFQKIRAWRYGVSRSSSSRYARIADEEETKWSKGMLGQRLSDEEF